MSKKATKVAHLGIVQRKSNYRLVRSRQVADLKKKMRVFVTPNAALATQARVLCAGVNLRPVGCSVVWVLRPVLPCVPQL